MRVIVANYRFFIAGGPEKYMFNFIKAAEERNIEVIPFSINYQQNIDSPYSKYFAKPRAEQLMYGDTKKSISNYWGMFRATVWNWDAEKRLRKLIRDTKPDCVYILHEINHLSPSIIRAAKKGGVKVVHRISDFFMFCPKYDFLCGNEVCEACLHGDYSKAIKNRCVKGSKIGTLLRVFSMKLYKHISIFDQVDSFICTCEFSRKKLIEGGVDPYKVSCVPTFIDVSSITPSYENDHYFLFLGRMAHQKGTIYAIEAMKYLAGTDYLLKITGDIGDSQEGQELWKYITENNLQDKVVFTGFLHGMELDKLIDRCTAVVCPAIWYENMPNALIEAYAHGKPVIASRIGCFQDAVIDEKTGFLFSPKDSKELSDRMFKYIKDEELSVHQGKNAREYCEKYFNKQKHIDKLISILFN